MSFCSRNRDGEVLRSSRNARPCPPLLCALFDNSLGVLGLLAQSDPLLPALPLVATTQELPLPAIVVPGVGLVINTGVFAGVILAGWYMLFRAHLFEALESGTRRRRMFEIKQR